MLKNSIKLFIFAKNNFLKTILEFFRNTDPVLGAFYATLFTWGLTALGASLVFFVKTMNRALLDGLWALRGVSSLLRVFGVYWHQELK